MKKYILQTSFAFVSIFMVLPGVSLAGTTLTFSPASPQAYGGATNPTETCDATGNNVWVAFNDAGANLGYATINCDDGGFHSAANPQLFSFYMGTDYSQPASTLDDFNGHAGTITFDYIDINVGIPTLCYGAAANQAACEGNSTFTSAGSHQVTYVLTGGGGGVSTSTYATTTPIDNANQDTMNIVVIFIASFWLAIWLFRKRN
jgi:hypothetical protein